MLTDAQRTILEGLAKQGSYLDHYSPTAALAIRTVLRERDMLEGMVINLQNCLTRIQGHLGEDAPSCS